MPGKGKAPGAAPRRYHRHVGPVQDVRAEFAYKNHGAGLPWIACYRCPACGREHRVGWRFPEDRHPGLRNATCDYGPLVNVLAPPYSQMFENPPSAPTSAPEDITQTPEPEAIWLDTERKER